MQAVGPVAVTSLLLGSGLPGVVDVPIQDDPNNPTDKHAQHVYNVAAIQVAPLFTPPKHAPPSITPPAIGHSVELHTYTITAGVLNVLIQDDSKYPADPHFPHGNIRWPPSSPTQQYPYSITHRQ